MDQTARPHDRRTEWQAPPRPEWLAQLNRLGALMDMKGIVPLDEASLLEQARRNTGLDDFGDTEWLPHFRMLLRGIEEEAKLNFFGRVLTRSDMLVYLQARLQITEAYKRHPEIDDEVIHEPVFIIGLGRSGTTILQEVLSQDPQYRSVRRWEGLFPWPAPEEDTYETDPRIRKSQDLVDVVHAASPEWHSMHAWGGNLPVECTEFTYPAFFSEVWSCTFQVPTYEKYFASRDPAYYYYWHKRTLKLLQWKFRRPHWLLKNPLDLARLPSLLAAYPDAKIILTHRDPVTSRDSFVNVQATIFHWRTDDVWGGNVLDEWMLADQCAAMWDRVIGLIEDGTIRKGYLANFLYHEFMEDPMSTLRKIYAELGLEASEQAFGRMQAFLDERNKGTHGKSQKYRKTASDDPVAARERAAYRRYQSYFGIPDET